MSSPIAVLISDIHFSLKTLELARASLMQAIRKANECGVHLYVLGDLHDSKAIIRGECANAMLECVREAHNLGVEISILVGNHDMINEKGTTNSINFLGEYSRGAIVFDRPGVVQLGNGIRRAHLIPYQNDSIKFLELVKGLKKGSLIFAHQGVKGAYMGEYVVDKTSVEHAELVDYTIFSGHYHRRQSISQEDNPSLFGVGTFNYLGSPYSGSFAEAGDGPKGFHVLMDDLTTRFITTGLRKHIILEVTLEQLVNSPGFEDVKPDDAIWLKVSGRAKELAQLSKKKVGLELFGHQNYRLDRIPTDTEVKIDKLETLTSEQLLDTVVDEGEQDPQRRAYLKDLWREVMV